MTIAHIRYGMYGGLAGGVVIGAMMGLQGSLPTIGKLVGRPGLITGLAVHILNSAALGAAFALTFGRRATSVRKGLCYGVLYGAVWWVVGPMTVVPLLLGAGVNWTFSDVILLLPSLVGHLIYGVVVGTIYGALQYLQPGSGRFRRRDHAPASRWDSNT